MCVRDCNEPEWNSAFRLPISSRFPLHHLHIQDYSTWCSEAVTYVGTDQILRCWTLVFQRDLTLSPLLLYSIQENITPHKEPPLECMCPDSDINYTYAYFYLSLNMTSLIHCHFSFRLITQNNIELTSHNSLLRKLSIYQLSPTLHHTLNYRKFSVNYIFVLQSIFMIFR